jgi:recombination protein RecA
MGGGLPMGRIVEIFGDTSSGKSLIAAQACATIQETGGIAIYVDTESAVSLPIMEAVGVNTETLVYMPPDTVEDVFKAMETALDLDTTTPMLIVWDSIAATSAEAEMDKATGETGYLTHARIISQGLRKLSRLISKRKVAVLMLNQIRTKIGVTFGNNVATFGGKAVSFHSSIRVHLKVSGKIKNSRTKRVIGVKTYAIVEKNKVAPPFRTATLPIYFGHGIDDADAMFEYLSDADVISHRGGGHYEIDGLEGSVTKKNWAAFYDEHYDELADMVLEAAQREDLL